MSDAKTLGASAASESSLALGVARLRPWLDEPTVTEVCIHAPGELWVERQGQDFERVAAAFVTAAWCTRLVKLVANYSRQRVDESTPLLSAALPSGERLQAVLPPATRFPVVALRRPAASSWLLGELAAQGMFAGVSERLAAAYADLGQTVAERPRALRAPEGLAEGLNAPGEGHTTGGMADLACAYAARDWQTFLRHAVRARCNILVSGATGSGKTTLTKALIAEIAPRERLVSIEDAAELEFARHPNAVQLFYSKESQGRSTVSPRQLLECSLRLRPDRILLAELRGEEAFYYLRNVNSGHPGSITSIHASSCAGAIEQLVLLVKQSPEGRGLTREDVRELVRASVEVIVQVERTGTGERRVRELWWRGEERK